MSVPLRCAHLSARWWYAGARPGELIEPAPQRLPRGLRSRAIAPQLCLDLRHRLARSTRDLLNILHAIGKAGATFKSLADAWADTTTPHGRLMVTILGGLAEFERDLIKARTDDGRLRAMARGKRFGREPKLTAHQITRPCGGAMPARARRT
jgi:Resolvase, N terminal domain